MERRGGEGGGGPTRLPLPWSSSIPPSSPGSGPGARREGGGGPTCLPLPWSSSIPPSSPPRSQRGRRVQVGGATALAQPTPGDGWATSQAHQAGGSRAARGRHRGGPRVPREASPAPGRGHVGRHSLTRVPMGRGQLRTRESPLAPTHSLSHSTKHPYLAPKQALQQARHAGRLGRRRGGRRGRRRAGRGGHRAGGEATARGSSGQGGPGAKVTAQRERGAQGGHV